MSLGERIKQIRKDLNLTQKQLAEQLDLKQNTIATYEMGRLTPSDRTISDICREFGVNELWLRTGEGEMFRAKTRETEISEYFERVLSDTDEFQRRFISVLSRLSADEWRLIESMAQKLAEETTKNPEDN